MGLLLFVLFIGVPLIEIMLFVKIGGAIGMTMTVVIVIATALVGSGLLRFQGLATLQKARVSTERGEVPMDSVVHGIFLVLAGAFLLTPGFLTDAIGFALFVPPVRLALGRAIMEAVLARGNVHVHSQGQTPSGPQQSPHSGGQMPGGKTIDGVAEEVDETPGSS